MTVIDRSIAFVSQWEPQFAAGLQGATATAIAELEARMERPCSPVYRAFAERMGEATGSIDLGQYSSSVSLLLEERGGALENLPPDVELFAMATGEDDDDLYLVHDPAAPDDVRLVRHPTLEYASTGDFDHGRVEAVAGGLAEFLCLPALNRHHVLVQPHRIALVDPQLDPDALARCRALAEGFGLVPYPFANPWTYVGHADDLVVIAKQAPGWFLSVGVAGPERFAWAAVAGTLRWRLGLELYR